MLIVFGPPNDQLSGRVARDLAFVALAALPGQHRRRRS